MTPRIKMPALRRLPIDPDRPLRHRLLWWREPVVYEVAEQWDYRRPGCYGVMTRVYAGFRTDLASTPALAWLFGYRPDGLMLIPGLLHDWYYRHGSVERVVAVESWRGRWSAPAGDGTRAWGDRLFRQTAREMGCPPLAAWAAWAALRLFGWWSWRANAPYRAAYAASHCKNFQLHGEYEDDHDDPAKPAGE